MIWVTSTVFAMSMQMRVAQLRLYRRIALQAALLHLQLIRIDFDWLILICFTNIAKNTHEIFSKLFQTLKQKTKQIKSIIFTRYYNEQHLKLAKRLKKTLITFGEKNNIVVDVLLNDDVSSARATTSAPRSPSNAFDDYIWNLNCCRLLFFVLRYLEFVMSMI